MSIFRTPAHDDGGSMGQVVEMVVGMEQVMEMVVAVAVANSIFGSVVNVEIRFQTVIIG